MHNKQEKGLLIVISGPSGVGKGTLCSALTSQDPSICYAVSATTRQPRRGEQEGSSYYFLDEGEFLRRRDNGEFLEWAEVFGNYYGTLHSEVERLTCAGKNVILEIDVQGAMQVKEACPDAVSIFILPPSYDELEKRIRLRGTESEEVRNLRLSQAAQEMTMAEAYDYMIINDDVDNAVRCIQGIIAKEKARR